MGERATPVQRKAPQGLGGGMSPSDPLLFQGIKAGEGTLIWQVLHSFSSVCVCYSKEREQHDPPASQHSAPEVTMGKFAPVSLKNQFFFLFNYYGGPNTPLPPAMSTTATTEQHSHPQRVAMTIPPRNPSFTQGAWGVRAPPHAPGPCKAHNPGASHSLSSM